MASPAIRVATADDKAAVLNVVLLAFVGDPFARWIFPGQATYLSVCPDFSDAFGGHGLVHGSVDLVEDERGAVGVAMWLPPGIEPDAERMLAILAEHAPETVLNDMGGLMEQMAAAHPAEPCWYLPIIGVDPAFHSRGIGSALLSYAIARADAEGLPAYLESSNPRNISLYERHGFVAMEAIQVGSSPPVVPMLRKPS